LPAALQAWQALDYSGALAAVWGLIRDANAFIESREPWKLHKSGDADGTAAVLGDCLEALRVVALLASPVIPRAGAELWSRLGLEGSPGDQRLPDAAEWGLGPAGTKLEKGDPLFPRIEPSE
jgi:methionyl-tRNA synthetase